MATLEGPLSQLLADRWPEPWGEVRSSDRIQSSGFDKAGIAGTAE